MPASATASSSASSTAARQRRRSWLTRLQDIPGLMHSLSLGGLVIWLFLGWLMWQGVQSSDSHYLHESLAQYKLNLFQFQRDFVREFVLWGLVIMAPAILVGFLRVRGIHLVMLISFISLGLMAYWMAGDLCDHFSSNQISVLGQKKPVYLYWWQFGLTVASFLCPAAFALFYVCSSILDRHLMRTFLMPLVLCLSGLIGLFIIFDLFDNVKDLIGAKFTPLQIVHFYLIQIPKFFVESVDISLLLALLYALSRLSRYNEIISMISAGRSVWRIILPLTIVGLFLTFISLACNFEWAPQAERKKDEMLQLADEKDLQKRERKANTGGARVAYMNREDRRLWFLGEIPLNLSFKYPMRNVEVHTWNENGLIERSIFASRAIWIGNQESPVWQFYGKVRVFQHQPNHPDPAQRVSDSRGESVEFNNWKETPWQLLSESSKIRAEYLSVPELVSYLETNRDLPKEKLAPYQTWWHDRLARPLRCLIVTLFAAPLGIVFSRRGLMGSVAMAMMLYFGMYFLTTIFSRLGETGKLPSATAAWMVNIIFGTVGLILLWQRARHTDIRTFFQRLFRRRTPSSAQPV
jgi:lipopolysaccharide export system permease protein